jgi:hypothetical protein
MVREALRASASKNDWHKAAPGKIANMKLPL